MFVNSGSEANDVAIQIARAVTGNRGAVITEHAYHGTTAATAALSPEELGPAALEPWVARIGGAATLGSPDAATLGRHRGRRRLRAAAERGSRAGPPDLRRRLLERRHLHRPARLPRRRVRAGPCRRRALHRRRGAGRLRPGRGGVLGLRPGRRRAGHRHPRQADGERAPDGRCRHDAGDRGRVRRRAGTSSRPSPAPRLRRPSGRPCST